MNKRKTVNPDPRTKIFLWLLANIALFFFRNTHFPLMLTVLYGVLFLLAGRADMILKTAGGFGLLYLMVRVILPALPSVVSFLMSMIFLFYILWPAGIGASYMISTTSVGELTDAMRRMRVPDTVSVMLAVVIRFIPMIRQRFLEIRSAMKLRKIRGLFRRLECIYVPMLVSVAETAEELGDSITARGIENPAPKTSWHQAGFHTADLLIGLTGLMMLGESLWELTGMAG